MHPHWESSAKATCGEQAGVGHWALTQAHSLGPRTASGASRQCAPMRVLSLFGGMLRERAANRVLLTSGARSFHNASPCLCFARNGPVRARFLVTLVPKVGSRNAGVRAVLGRLGACVGLLAGTSARSSGPSLSPRRPQAAISSQTFYFR